MAQSNQEDDREQEDPPQGGYYPNTPEQMAALYRMIQQANELARQRQMNEILASIQAAPVGMGSSRPSP